MVGKSTAFEDVMELTAEDERELQELRRLIDSLSVEGPPRVAFVHRAAQGIARPGQRLGVLSGSFNPLTRAHTRMARLAVREYRLDEVAFELAVANVDKEALATELAARLWVLRHYAAGRPHLSIIACSHGRFIEKVQALEAVYPAQTELYFIAGYDTLVRVFDPRYYANAEQELGELFAHSHFIVANRGEHTPADVRRWIESSERQPYAGHIHVIQLDDFHAHISATEIRQRLHDGQSFEDLVPPEIVPYVRCLP